MPEPFGVLPTGFNVKQLHEIIQEIETENAQSEVFGPAIIQTAQSPLGQINALFGDFVGDLWQLALAVYLSYDVDQADGVRLDVIAKLRGLERNNGESDIDFRARITNVGKIDISLRFLINKIAALDGVSWVSVRENSTGITDAVGLTGHSLAIAVEGGDDEAIAAEIYHLTVAGIGLVGNVAVPIDLEGYCRTIGFVRPIAKTVSIEVTVRSIADICNCSPPTKLEIQQSVVDELTGDCGMRNGDTLYIGKVRGAIERLEGVEVVDVKIGVEGDPVGTDPITTDLFERIALTVNHVQVSYSDA